MLVWFSMPSLTHSLSRFAPPPPPTPTVRPLIAGMKAGGIRRSGWYFLVTLKKATGVLVLFLFLMIIATTQGMLLFYNRRMGMDDILEAFMNVFTFMVSVENFLGMAWTGTDCNKEYLRKRSGPGQDPTENTHSFNTFLGGPQTGGCIEAGFHIYTIVYSFMGMVRKACVCVCVCVYVSLYSVYSLCFACICTLTLERDADIICSLPRSFPHLSLSHLSHLLQYMMLSLVIGVFESTFVQKHEASLSAARRKRRGGLLIAFYTLDKDHSNVLTPNEFVEFIQKTCNTGLEFDIEEVRQKKREIRREEERPLHTIIRTVTVVIVVCVIRPATLCTRCILIYRLRTFTPRTWS